MVTLQVLAGEGKSNRASALYQTKEARLTRRVLDMMGVSYVRLAYDKDRGVVPVPGSTP